MTDDLTSKQHDLSAEYELPCDVHLPPNTYIGKGCKLSTLMAALKVRERHPCEFPERTAVPPNVLLQHFREVVADYDYGVSLGSNSGYGSAIRATREVVEAMRSACTTVTKVDRWTCVECGVLNENDRTNCKGCQLARNWSVKGGSAHETSANQAGASSTGGVRSAPTPRGSLPNSLGDSLVTSASRDLLAQARSCLLVFTGEDFGIDDQQEAASLAAEINTFLDLSGTAESENARL